MVDKAKFLEDEQGYRITIVGRHVFVTEAMKNYALEKLSKIDRFHNHVLDLHVTMDIQKLEHSVMIVLKFNHFKIKVGSASTDMYVSIDKAVDKLQSQLRRWKGKIQDHHKKTPSIVDLQVSILQKPYTDLDEINDEIESANRQAELEEYRPPKIIGNETRSMKMLTAAEAVMKMELSGDGFMLFRGEEDNKLKVIYRREDGNYGIILPE
jgi:putative sigma-54 modulation protein